jgi:hypothetical protein
LFVDEVEEGRWWRRCTIVGVRGWCWWRKKW